MFRIFYFNINFFCNNNCLFCFSHSTFFNNKYVVNLEDVERAIRKYNISSEDRVVINGGEPTLHYGLLEMLTIIHDTGAQIVLYTNGRKLKEKDYCIKLGRLVNRIVIPIHGNNVVHDSITQKPGSYFETMQGLSNMTKFAQEKLELKFIVTDKMINSSFSISNFLKDNSFSPNSIALTGVVDTKVCKENSFPQPSPEILGIYVSSQLDDLFRFFNGSIKLFDCRLCYLSSHIMKFIESLPLSIDNNTAYDYYYFDGKYKDGKSIKYNDNRPCTNCKYINICRSVLDSCAVLEIYSDRKKIVLE